MHGALAHPELAREAFAAALGPLAARVKAAPDDPYQLLLLGRAHAGVGRPEDALREARRALELWRGEEREGLALRLLAEIAAAAGRNEEALDALRRVLARRDGLLTLASLRMDPRFAPLRRDPRFAALADGSTVAARR